MREITRDVWSTNLEEAMRDLRRLVESYPYIAIVRGPPQCLCGSILCISFANSILMCRTVNFQL